MEKTKKAWVDELEEGLSVRIHLFCDWLADAKLREHVKSCGALVYSRHESDVDFEIEVDEFDPNERNSNFN
jgi:hypothetical protein